MQLSANVRRPGPQMPGVQNRLQNVTSKKKQEGIYICMVPEYDGFAQMRFLQGRTSSLLGLPAAWTSQRMNFMSGVHDTGRAFQLQRHVQAGRFCVSFNLVCLL